MVAPGIDGVGDAGLGEAVARFCRSLERFDPALTAPEDCAAAVGLLATVERACRLKKAQAAARATSDGARGRDGSPDGAHWLAQLSGQSVGAARRELDVVAALADAPAVAEAVASGRLSLDQAHEIASAVRANPDCEGELVELAARAPMATLRERARKRRHEAVDAEELHRRQRQARTLRVWTNDIGNVAFAGEMPPAAGVPFANRLQAETDRVWRAARRAAKTSGAKMESRDAYALDALARIVEGGGRGHATRADVVIVCDLRAWRRGRADRDGREVCHLVGGAPIPVAVAKEFAGDGFLKAVIHDGVEVLKVAHFGRHVPAELRTALDLGPPPSFEGVVCQRSGCGRRHGLEWDHVDPVANDGPTAYENLRPLCYQHHQEKTELDRLAGLLRRRPPDRPPP